jgi:hypothetical protein
MAAHGQDERKSELVVVRLVEFVQTRELIECARIDACAALLARRFGSKAGALRGRRVRDARGSEPTVRRRLLPQRRWSSPRAIEHRSEWASGHTPGDPGGMLENAVERCGRLAASS